MSGNPYDLAIIGAGSAGLIAADFARKLGARVILLERDRIGGDCTWTGCVPSKSLLKVARVAHETRTAARFGLQSQPPVVDMAAVREYLHSTIARIYEGTTPDALRRKDIEVHFGAVRFVDAHNLAVGDERIRAKKILIATGAHPRIPSLPGLDVVPYSTYQNIFENDRLPRSMAVIGGGPVGVEVAQAYQRLGARVTIFAERLLPKEEPEASEIVRSVLQREGLQLVAERALSVARNGNQISVRSQHGQTDCDLLFVAAGRRPTLDGLNLEAAGVAYSERGIETNHRLQTSTKHIFAAGDVLGRQQFSHYAGWQGFQATRNALLPGSASGVAADVPRVTFTDPEVAQIGKTEAEARAAHANDVVVTSWPIDREDRAVCDDDRDGLLKLITSRGGTILGATVVARRAGDVITELVLAMRHKLEVSQLAGTIHPYPTYATGIQLLASDVAVDHVLSGLSGRLIRAASRIAR
jgi:pyruvate/2-oxoglutarate dehydrogenase complex dihydrolipoamide dehydrogenase (E3) component